MAKTKINKVDTSVSTIPTTFTRTTVAEAHEAAQSEGLQIHWRPERKLNPMDPDNDVALIMD